MNKKITIIISGNNYVQWIFLFVCNRLLAADTAYDIHDFWKRFINDFVAWFSSNNLANNWLINEFYDLLRLM